jgi:hypothetical protein
MKNKPFLQTQTLFFLALLMFSQNTQAQTLRTDKPDLTTFASAQIEKTIALPPALSEDCIRNKRMKLAGIGLSIGAGVFLIAGIAMYASGESQATNYYTNSFNGVSNSSTGTGLISGGGALIGIGVATLCTGVPLAVIGSIRYNKSCKSTALELHTASHGTGLALAF